MQYTPKLHFRYHTAVKKLLTNFDVEIVWDYGRKHFFGFIDLQKKNTDNVLFIGIVRNLVDWINSLYRDRHHIPIINLQNKDVFFTNTFYSFDFDCQKLELTNTEIMEDRNMETKERYKNIFELRQVKNKFLIEKMPKLVKNYCLLTYDNLTSNFIETMNQLKNYGLKVKNNIEFPINIYYYKNLKNTCFRKKENEITKEEIQTKITNNKELLFYESLLFPKNTL